MSILPILTYRRQAIPVIIPLEFLVKILKLTLVLICKEPRMPKEMVRNNRVEEFKLASRLTRKLHYQDRAVLGGTNKSVELNRAPKKGHLYMQQRYQNNPMGKKSVSYKWYGNDRMCT